MEEILRASGTMGRLLFGAVAQKLIGTLPVPTLIVRAAPSRAL